MLGLWGFPAQRPQPTSGLLCGVVQVGHCPKVPRQQDKCRLRSGQRPVYHACPLGQGCVCQEWGTFKTHTKVLCGLAAVLTAPLDKF